MIKKVALIPARKGSKRLENKNIKILNGHPLIAYSIVSAINSGLFSNVVCATDSEEYAKIAIQYGALVPELRKNDISEDVSPDIDWVKWILNLLENRGYSYDQFAILRPTSPFRTSDTIKRAFKDFNMNSNFDSLRAVEKCKQHPGKMWKLYGDFMTPILPYHIDETPWHSSQYSNLPEIFVQNACIEIANTTVIKKFNSISGNRIKPFFTNPIEGIDINSLDDWEKVENILSKDNTIIEKINLKTNI